MTYFSVRILYLIRSYGSPKKVGLGMTCVLPGEKYQIQLLEDSAHGASELLGV